jgi:dTDP-4-dehydrorhamnose reductase
MKILLTGKHGQVGFELNKKLSALYDVIAIGREDLDLNHPNDISAFIDKIKPNLIIHPAAYTAVDKAESESETAYQVNVVASQTLANKASELNIPIIYFSTDYVFDGLKKESYLEEDKAHPQSLYGKTKLEGEGAIKQHPKHIILRASWVFGIHGHNFIKTILKLIQEKDNLSVVSDQWGAPTSASMLADVTFKIVQKIFESKDFKDFGTYHVASQGETNWHQYAMLIYNEAIRLGVSSKMKPSDIKPILTEDYATAAKRPLNSRLNTEKIKKTFMLELPYWEDEVKKVIRELIH